MSKQTMSEIIAAYNSLAAEQGKEEVTSFKNLAAARAALKTLESTPMTDETPEIVYTVGAADAAEQDAVEATDAVEQDVIPAGNKGGPKYNSAGKRGPTQGVGAFCKELIAEGKTNAEILEAVAEQFPTAKTSKNCVAYYRAKMKVTPVADEVAEEAEEEVAA